jgi:GntR family transcriptional repressor for pyruvate dehydrogenase complex
MDDLLAHAEAHLDDDDVLNATNMAFHRAIAEASGNGVLHQLLDVLTSLFQAEQRAIIDIYGSRRRDHTEHVAILDALRARDADLAGTRMRAHLEGVRAALLQWDGDA